jgi:hypothetical protein
MFGWQGSPPSPQSLIAFSYQPNIAIITIFVVALSKKCYYNDVLVSSFSPTPQSISNIPTYLIDPMSVLNISSIFLATGQLIVD